MIVAHVFFNIAVVVRLVGAMWARSRPTSPPPPARSGRVARARCCALVVLPLLRPALWAAATVVFLFTFTSFGVVRLLGGPANPTLEVEIARRATQLGDVDGAAVLSLLQLLGAGGGGVVVGSLAAAGSGGPAWRRRCPAGASAGERRFVAGAGIATAVVMITPLLVLISRSFRLGDGWSLRAWRTLGSVEVRPGVSLGVDPIASLLTSFRFAVVAATVSVLVGGLAALAISSARRHGRLLDVGLMLPLGTSAVTIGLGMLITFDTAPFDWRASWWLMPLGHALVATPFVTRALLPVLRAIPSDQRAAAAHTRRLATAGLVGHRRAARPAPAGRGCRPCSSDLAG